jgi:hypothetical protein
VVVGASLGGVQTLAEFGWEASRTLEQMRAIVRFTPPLFVNSSNNSLRREHRLSKKK